jgi:hypothetical protein
LADLDVGSGLGVVVEEEELGGLAGLGVEVEGAVGLAFGSFGSPGGAGEEGPGGVGGGIEDDAEGGLGTVEGDDGDAAGDDSDVPAFGFGLLDDGGAEVAGSGALDAVVASGEGLGEGPAFGVGGELGAGRVDADGAAAAGVVAVGVADDDLDPAAGLEGDLEEVALAFGFGLGLAEELFQGWPERVGLFFGGLAVGVDGELVGGVAEGGGFEAEGLAGGAGKGEAAVLAGDGGDPSGGLEDADLGSGDGLAAFGVDDFAF